MSEPRRIVEASPDSEAAKLLSSLDTTPPPHAGARVWRRLSEREHPRPWARRGAVGLSALAAGLGLVYLGTSKPSAPAEVLASRGAVELSVAPDRHGGLPTGTRIKVGHGGQLRLSIGGAAAELLALSEATVVAIEQIPALELSAGAIEVAVPGDEANLMVIAGRARVELPRGAAARIERGGDEALVVAVRQGPVVISDAGTRTVLQAGETRSFGGRMALAAPSALGVAETGGLSPPPRPSHDTVAAPEEAAPAPEAAEPSTSAPRRRSSGRAPRRAPEQSAQEVVPAPPPPAAAATEAPAAAMVRSPTPEIPRAEAPRTERSPTPDIPRREGPRAEPPRTEAHAAPTFDEAAVYRRARSSTTLAEALRLYDEVRDHRGALAEVAAHQAANLLLRGERYAEAAARLEGALALFPAGALAQDGRLSLIECRIRQSDLGRAKQDLDRFLADYPGSERSPDLRFVRAEIARRSERCEAAVPDYKAAAGGRNADDAAYFLAWCAMQTSEAEGRAALDAYLSQFPRGKHAAQARARLSKKE